MRIEYISANTAGLHLHHQIGSWFVQYVMSVLGYPVISLYCDLYNTKKNQEKCLTN
jgi:hypothetical protein